MQLRARRQFFLALLCFSLLGCSRKPAAPSAADLLLDYAHCWPHEVVDRGNGMVRLEVLGVYMPDQGALALSGRCPQGALLGWPIRDYQNDAILKKLDGFLLSDPLGPSMAGFRANVAGHFEIRTGHLGLQGLNFEVAEWRSLERVSPELSSRLERRLDRAKGPI